MPRVETSQWQKFENGASTQRHVFATTDIHGQFSIARKLIDHFREIPKQTETVFINIGDALDRGSAGLRVVDLLMSQDENFDHVQLLCGNHEIMLMDAFWQFGVDLGGHETRFSRSNLEFWLDCGGAAVYRELSPERTLPYHEMPAIVAARFGPYIQRLANRASPAHVEGDLLFVHAGLMPGRMSECLALGPQENVVDGHHWAWIRKPFLRWKGGWDTPGRTIVHGHTVCVDEQVPTLKDAVKAMDRVAKKSRICLDIGAFPYGHLAGLEALGDSYRFHICFED